MRRVFLFMVALTIVSAFLMGGCKKESGDDNSALLLLLMAAAGSDTYGGTSPIGDFIEVDIDRLGKTVTQTNYTTGVVNGPYAYTAVSAVDANGFSILNRAVIDASGSYVLFSEFPGAAVVYQIFDSGGSAVGWPVYVVNKGKTKAGNYYSTAYNWMMFFIDADSTESDMECGFAAFDDPSTGGLLYGAGYSNRREAEGETAIQDINEGDTVSIDAFVWNDAMKALINYDPSHGTDMAWAMSLSGTPSGSAILDFGPGVGGGGALAIPQASSKTFSSSYAGTYFAVLYEFNKGTNERTVNPIKVVLTGDASPAVSIFNYADKTDAGGEIFTSSLTSLEDFTGGPNAPAAVVYQDFQTVSGNSSAVSTAAQNAHLCHGSFIAANGSVVLVITFDPSGRFCSYTMFDDNGTGISSDDVIRFGFAIKDAGYTNSY